MAKNSPRCKPNPIRGPRMADEPKEFRLAGWGLRIGAVLGGLVAVYLMFDAGSEGGILEFTSHMYWRSGGHLLIGYFIAFMAVGGFIGVVLGALLTHWFVKVPEKRGVDWDARASDLEGEFDVDLDAEVDFNRQGESK